MTQKSNPPGPPPSLFGLKNVEAFRLRPLEFITSLAREYGDIAYFRLGPYRAYLLNHPDLIRDVLVTKASSFRKLPQQVSVMRQIEGNGLLVSDGQHWRRQRELMQPAFRTQYMARYAQTIVDYAEQMLDDWPSDREIDVAEEMGRVTLLIMARTLLGVDLSARYDEVRTMVHNLSAAMMRDIRTPLRMDWLPTAANRRKRQAIQAFDDLLWQIIDQRKASLEQSDDVLAILLAAANDPASGMSAEGVRDEVATVFNAGHDTAAAAMTWAWLAIAQHPEIEAKVVAEVDRVLGDRPPRLEDVKKLTYTEMVVKETMRLYPPGWTLFAREAKEDVQVGDYAIPRKSWLYLFPYVTHRDGRFFDNPDCFDPERFSPERESRIPSCAYFPFGAGPHACIGTAFAMMELTLLVALVLRRFHLELCADGNEIEEEALLNLWPKGGLRMIATKRGNNNQPSRALPA